MQTNLFSSRFYIVITLFMVVTLSLIPFTGTLKVMAASEDLGSISGTVLDDSETVWRCLGSANGFSRNSLAYWYEGLQTTDSDRKIYFADINGDGEADSIALTFDKRADTSDQFG